MVSRSHLLSSREPLSLASRFDPQEKSESCMMTILLQGMDVIAQAQSGTGKTATFSIAILEKIDTNLRECQALLLAPTRELAQQIQKVVMSLGDYMGAQCHACIGGTSVREDMRKLDAGQHIVVGTPGRVYDMISRKVLRPTDIKQFVLDEADEMLRMGFIDEVEWILDQTPKGRQMGKRRIVTSSSGGSNLSPCC